MSGEIKYRSWDLASDWWESLFSRATLHALRRSSGMLEHTRRVAEMAAQGTHPRAIFQDAASALRALTACETFSSLGQYLDRISEIQAGFDVLNWLQSEVTFGINGAVVQQLDYDSTACLAEYASSNSLLRLLMVGLLDKVDDPPNILFLRIKDKTELLQSMILNEEVKGRWPDCQVVLGDHGYENFSLHGVLGAQSAHPLLKEFDTVIVDRQEISDVMTGLVGQPLEGRAEDPSTSIAAGLRTFAPARILSMRLSEGRCYWAKCTYCTQNAKFGNGRAPSKADLVTALPRIRAMAAAGFTHFQFSDEALSPALLNQFADQLIASGISVKWACRSKLETAFDLTLFEKLRRAGCYEVLFGLETIVPRVQRIMDKFDPRLNRPEVKRILADAAEAGVGIHLNMIGAFPGETQRELEQSVDFLIEVGKNTPNFTFLLNEFVLFRDTPIADHPERFGIALEQPHGDIVTALPYRSSPSVANQSGPDCVYSEMIRAFEALGWSSFREVPAGDLAVHLYFSSGHGVVFKSGELSFSPYESASVEA